MPHIIVWWPNVISVIGGDTLTRYAIFGSVEDVTPQDMWSITVQSTHLPNQKLATLMGGPTLTMMTSTPLWMTTREMVCVEPGAQIYKGGNVTISFLSHIFFLISVVWCPYFSFAPSYEETNLWLLAFPEYSSPSCFLFSIALFHRTVSLLGDLSRGNYVSPTFHRVLRPSA